MGNCNAVIASYDYTLKPTGHRQQVIDHTGATTTYGYDDLYRLIQEDLTNHPVLGNITNSYTYDAVGNRTQVKTTLPTNPATIQITTYGYDALNRLASVTDPQGGITTYTYDAVGNRASVSYPNGNVTAYTYDNLNRLVSMESRDNTNTIIASYNYTLNPTGHRQQVIDDTGATTAYSYDDLYRLTQEDLINHPVLGAVTNSYSYDPVGNRTSSTEDGINTTYTYDMNDRLLTTGGETYTYDANGNTLTVVNGTILTTNTYDFLNRLTRMVKQDNGTTVDDVSYAYDMDGLRTAKNDDGVLTKYLVDKNRDYAQVLNELTSTNIPTVSYVYGDDLIKQSRAANESYYLYDGLGSTRALSDSTGAVTDSYDYNAYGTQIDTTGSTPNSYRFTGEQFDTSLNQYYLRARYYDPAKGRFTTMDTWEGTSSNPASLHKYAYGNLDPVNNIDPSGRLTLNSVMASINIQAILVKTTVSGVSFAVGFGFGDYAFNAGLHHEYTVDNIICKKTGVQNDTCNFENETVN